MMHPTKQEPYVVQANTDSEMHKVPSTKNGRQTNGKTNGKTTLVGTGAAPYFVEPPSPRITPRSPQSHQARSAQPRPDPSTVPLPLVTRAGLGDEVRAAKAAAAAAAAAEAATDAGAASAGPTSLPAGPQPSADGSGLDGESRNRTLVMPRVELARAGGAGGHIDETKPVTVLPTWATPPDPERLVMLGEQSPEAAAALRVIRHRLEQLRDRGRWTFGVTSAREGEGKTTFATQLALVLSESQRARVLLVEASFERPTLARLLGFNVPEGGSFSRQIVRKMRGSLEPWKVVALGPALHVLAESTTERGYPETLHATHFQNAIAFLAQGYDFVVVDSPSVLESGDANVVENAVDGMILVAHSGRSKGADLREAVAQLGERSAIGTVLWDAEPRAKKASRR